MEISKGAQFILDRLWTQGEGYLVGGCVRDFLLGQPCHDEDICSSLLPGEIQSLFADLPQTDQGLKHGTVGLILEGRLYEVTTYREDGAYSDHRRPDQVTFTRSLKEDLARRDFTINAMAMGPDGEIIDPFGGQADLKAGLVRAVGNPWKRFEEDSLRLLRAVRFANRLGFLLDPQTEEAIRDQAGLLSAISKERIAEEFLKILDDDPEGVTWLHDLGLLQYAYPEIDLCFNCPQETPYHLYDVGRHSVAAAKAGQGRVFRVASLLHDLGKPAAKTYDASGRAHFYDHAKISADLAAPLLRKLFLSREDRQLILALIRWHDMISKRPTKLARLVRDLPDSFWPLFFQLKRADIEAQSDLDREAKLRLVDDQEALIDRLLAGPHRLQDLAVTGRDLQDLGYQGPAIGEALAEILCFVMEKPSRNQRDYLLERAGRLLPDPLA
ncbi:MAG: HD domain-containing protein [Eubacteriales bacterium]|nr:HD domain-containing protein [Eubacteriales bacterium]